MKISVKDLHADMELKNKGMELEVRDTNGEFRGDFIITKSGVIWCDGKTQRANGIKKNWDELIKLLNE